MKKTILSLAIIAITTVAANAQQPDQSMQQYRHDGQFNHRGQFGRGSGGQGMMMAHNLHFSDQQKQQMKSINTDFHKKLADLKKNEDITIREFKSRISTLQKDHKSQMEAVLTPAQKDQIAKEKQKRMEMAKVDADARAEKMKIKLNLTDAQAAQLKTARTDMMTKMKSIRSDNSLSQEQKHDQIKDLLTKQKDQLKTILSPDQLQQMQQMRGQDGPGQQHHRRDFSK